MVLVPISLITSSSTFIIQGTQLSFANIFIKNQISNSWSFQVFWPNELLTIVIVALQVAGKEYNKIKVFTLSSNLIST